LATIENLATVADLRAYMEGLDEVELVAQQISQQGAIHALDFLVANGAGVPLVVVMLASLRNNMAALLEIAEAKGLAHLFDHHDAKGLH
jgi:hypothetical protein